MIDLTAPDARAQRDQLATRTDVLNKIGTLVMLPGDTYASTDLVARFYEVSREVIRQTISRNRDEFDDDGFKVVSRREVCDIVSLTPSDLGMGSAPSMSLFPRRAILRFGMLLRDSPVARQVRDHLLNVEEATVVAIDTSDPIAAIEAAHLRAGAAIELAKAERDRRVVAEQRIEADAPKVNYIDRYVHRSDLLTFRTVAAVNGIGETALRDLLIDRGWIYCQTDSYHSKRENRVKVRYRYSAHSHKRLYFCPSEVHDAPRFKGEVMHTLKVTPEGAEAISRLLGKRDEPRALT